MTSEVVFQDHFSDLSAQYAQYRPDYPTELYSYLAENCLRHELALDCATGSGQCALGLSHHFSRVIATDASESQIGSAMPSPRVSYRVAAAENSELQAQSVDLLTVAQALHWFDHPRFFTEARRVLQAGGLLASWFYKLCLVNVDCDAAVYRLYEEIVGDFWPPERRFIDADYTNIEFPEKCFDVPTFQMHADWTVQDMLGYLRTWSACKRYEKQHGEDPVSIIEPELTLAWGGTVRRVSWPLTVKACRL